MRQIGVGEAGRDVVGEPGAELVGDTGNCVALVDDERDAATSSHEVGGHGDVAAEADDDVGSYAVDHLAGRLDGLAKLGWHENQILAGLAWQRHRRHQLQLVARLRDQGDLEPARRTKAHDLGTALAQDSSGGQER